MFGSLESFLIDTISSLADLKSADEGRVYTKMSSCHVWQTRSSWFSFLNFLLVGFKEWKTRRFLDAFSCLHFLIVEKSEKPFSHDKEIWPMTRIAVYWFILCNCVAPRSFMDTVTIYNIHVCACMSSMCTFLQYRISSFSSCQWLACVFALFPCTGRFVRVSCLSGLRSETKTFVRAGLRRSDEQWKPANFLACCWHKYFDSQNSKTCCLSSEENQMFEVSSKNRKALHFRDIRFPSLKLEGDSSKFPAGAGRLKWFVGDSGWNSERTDFPIFHLPSRLSVAHQADFRPALRKTGRPFWCPFQPPESCRPWKDEEKDETRMHQCLWQKRLWATKS